jgi:hypothetical protein
MAVLVCYVDAPHFFVDIMELDMVTVSITSIVLEDLVAANLGTPWDRSLFWYAVLHRRLLSHRDMFQSQ